MFGTKEEIVKNIDSLMAQAMLVVNERKFGAYITTVYWVGGTLCVDVRYSSTIKFVVMVNVNGEIFSVIQFYNNIIGNSNDSNTINTNTNNNVQNLHNNTNSDDEIQNILPLESLKMAFIIYEKMKGKTKYYNECLKQSCLRHFDSPFELKSEKLK